MTDTLADFEYNVLTTEVGRALLEQVISVSSPGPSHLTRWRSLAPAEWVNAAIRMLDCRRRGTLKYSRASSMWLDPVGLEQATTEVVARYKAGRFEGKLVVDLCSGIGGDALALAENHDVIAVDHDPGMCQRLAWNGRVYEVSDRVQPVVADAEGFGIPSGAWVHIDPDRRTAADRNRSHRVRNIGDYVPGPSALKALARVAPAMAIKLSPASDFESHFSGSQFEVELISLNGECKEATVWSGDARTCRRRATRLPDGITWTDCDAGAVDSAPIFADSDWRWIYDPDPALLRAGLLDGFALSHGLGRFGGSVDYLVGTSLVRSAFLPAFEVVDIFPLDLKRLKRELSKRDLGRLEIKVRGAEVIPEVLRASLKLAGSQSATLLIGGKNPTRAILANRVELF